MATPRAREVINVAAILSDLETKVLHDISDISHSIRDSCSRVSALLVDSVESVVNENLQLHSELARLRVWKEGAETGAETAQRSSVEPVADFRRTELLSMAPSSVRFFQDKVKSKDKNDDDNENEDDNDDDNSKHHVDLSWLQVHSQAAERLAQHLHSVFFVPDAGHTFDSVYGPDVQAKPTRLFGYSRSVVRNLVKSTAFERFYTCVILASCGLVGAQAHAIVMFPDSPAIPLMEIADDCFTVLFLLEILLKLHGYGLKIIYPEIKNAWNIMDLTLVVLAVFFGWVLSLVALAQSSANTFDSKVVPVVRVIRLFRLARVVRVSEYFHEVWLLLQGIIDSMRILVFTMVVICFVSYAFACVGLTFITQPLLQQSLQIAGDGSQQDIDLHGLLDRMLGLDKFIYTLIQVLSQDSDELQRTTMAYLQWSWIFYMSFQALGKLVLLNLVTAIIVDHALRTSNGDELNQLRKKEKQQQDEIRELEALFSLIDQDGNGKVSVHEFTAAFEDTRIVAKWRLLDFKPEECKELFQLLDAGKGEIDTKEFFTGLMKMRGDAQSRDVFKLTKQVKEVQSGIDEIMDKLGAGAKRSRHQAGSWRSSFRSTKASKAVAMSAIGANDEDLNVSL